MKKLFSITMSVCLLSSIVTPVFATTPSTNFRLKTSDNFSSRSAIREQKMQVRLDNRMENLHDRAIREIDRRIASLNKLITYISAFKKLSSSQNITNRASKQRIVRILHLRRPKPKTVFILMRQILKPATGILSKISRQ